MRFRLTEVSAYRLVSWWAHFFLDHHWLQAVCRLGYFALPLAIGLAHFFYAKLRPEKRERFFIMKGFIAIAVIGWLLYLLFPVAGPVYLMPSYFPHAPLSVSDTGRLLVQPVAMPIYIRRNAMPSLHMAWALLIFYSMYRFRGWLRWLSVGFVAITVLATLGLGEHYLIDLVVAFPFTLAILGLVVPDVSWRSTCRTRAILYGSILTALWLVMLRYEPKFFWMSPLLPWSMIAATLMTSIYLTMTIMSQPEVEAAQQSKEIFGREPLKA